MKPHGIHGELDDDDDDDHHTVFSTGYRASSWSHPCDHSSACDSFLSKQKITQSPSLSSISNEMRGSTNLSSISIMSAANSFVSSVSSTSSQGWTGRRELTQAWNVSDSSPSTSSQGYHMHFPSEEQEKRSMLQDKYSCISTQGFGQESSSLMANGSIVLRTSQPRNGFRALGSSALSKSDSCLFTTPAMALSPGIGNINSTDVLQLLSSSSTGNHGIMPSFGNNSIASESSTKYSLHASAQSSISLADKGYSLSSMNNSVLSEVQDELFIGNTSSLQKSSAANSLCSELPSMTTSSLDINNPFTNTSSSTDVLMNPCMQKTKSSTSSLMKGSVWLKSGSGAQLCCVIVLLLLLLLLLPLVLPPLPPPPLEFLFLPIIILFVLVCQALLSPQLNLVAVNERSGLS